MELGEQVDMFIEATLEMQGAEVVLTWPAQGYEGWTRGTMWNNTQYKDGGYPTAFFNVVKDFNSNYILENKINKKIINPKRWPKKQKSSKIS